MAGERVVHNTDYPGDHLYRSGNPIAKAAAYATHPGQSGMVLSIGAIGASFEIALPGVIGLLAAQFGLSVALGALGAAPLVALLFAPRRRDVSPRTDPGAASGSHDEERAAR